MTTDEFFSRERRKCRCTNLHCCFTYRHYSCSNVLACPSDAPLSEQIEPRTQSRIHSFGCCHHTADRHSMQRRCSYCSSTSRGSSRSSRSTTIATSDSRIGSNKNAPLGVFDIISRRAKSGKLRGGRMSILFPPGMVRICSPCRFQLRDDRERVLRRYFDADIAM